VVAILVALVQLGGLLEIKPGIAAYSFAGVVMVTMVAAEQFDPRLMWDQLDNNNDSSET
jgi:paraquat-inducible protein A